MILLQRHTLPGRASGVGHQRGRRDTHQHRQRIRPPSPGLPGQPHHASGRAAVHHHGTSDFSSPGDRGPQHRTRTFQRGINQTVCPAGDDDNRAPLSGHRQAHPRGNARRITGSCLT